MNTVLHTMFNRWLLSTLFVESNHNGLRDLCLHVVYVIPIKLFFDSEQPTIRSMENARSAEYAPQHLCRKACKNCILTACHTRQRLEIPDDESRDAWAESVPKNSLPSGYCTELKAVLLVQRLLVVGWVYHQQSYGA